MIINYFLIWLSWRMMLKYFRDSLYCVLNRIVLLRWVVRWCCCCCWKEFEPICVQQHEQTALNRQFIGQKWNSWGIFHRSTPLRRCRWFLSCCVHVFDSWCSAAAVVAYHPSFDLCRMSLCFLHHLKSPSPNAFFSIPTCLRPNILHNLWRTHLVSASLCVEIMHRFSTIYPMEKSIKKNPAEKLPFLSLPLPLSLALYRKYITKYVQCICMQIYQCRCVRVSEWVSMARGEAERVRKSFNSTNLVCVWPNAIV